MVEKRISVSNAVRAHLAEVYNCSTATVSNSLQYRFEGEKSKWIRNAAIKTEGVKFVITLDDYQQWRDALDFINGTVAPRHDTTNIKL